MRFNARSRTSAAIYPQKCCPFSRPITRLYSTVFTRILVYSRHRRRPIVLLVCSSFSRDWGRDTNCRTCYFAFFSWRNIIVIIIVFGNIRLKYGIRNLKNFIGWKIFGYFSFRNSSSNSRFIVLRYCLVELNNHERKSDFKIHRFSRVFRSCLSFPRRSILMLFNFPYVITIFPRESFFQEKILKKLFYFKVQSNVSCISLFFLLSWNTTSIYHFVLITLSCRDLVSLRKFSTVRFLKKNIRNRNWFLASCTKGEGGWSFNGRLFSRYDSFPVRRFFDCMEIL